MLRLESAVFGAIISLYTIWYSHEETSVLSFSPLLLVVKTALNQPKHLLQSQYRDRNQQHRRRRRFGMLLYTTTTNNMNHHSKFQWEYGCTSCAGTDPDRPTKVNQDGAFFASSCTSSSSSSSSAAVVDAVIPNLTPQPQSFPYNITIFGVMDGHGKKGHEVVQYLQQQLPIRVQEYVERALKSQTNDTEDVESRNDHVISVVNGVQHSHSNESFSLEAQKIELISMGHADPSELFHTNTMEDDDNNVDHMIKAAIVDAFIHTQYDLRQNPNVPSSRSGTTCICCVLFEDKQQQHVTLYTANVGDSRAILITDSTMHDDTNVWTVQSLTNATTVHLAMERNRIERCPESRIDTNGNVFYGPIGIAMTRSLGNSVMLRAGIVPIPIITKHNLQWSSLNTTNENRGTTTFYICAGTDGIFDVLSNDKVVNWVQPQPNDIPLGGSLQNATINICQAAKLAWLADLPIETKVDDCTMAILQLSHCISK